MSRGDGAHTHHGHGGGGGVALLVVVLVLIAAAAKPVESAVRTAGHVLAVVLEVVVIGLAVAAAVAVAAVLTWAGIRMHRWHSSRRDQVVPQLVHAEVIQPAPSQVIEPAPQQAIEPSRSWPGLNDVLEDRVGAGLEPEYDS